MEIARAFPSDILLRRLKLWTFTHCSQFHFFGLFRADTSLFLFVIFLPISLSWLFLYLILYIYEADKQSIIVIDFTFFPFFGCLFNFKHNDDNYLMFQHVLECSMFLLLSMPYMKHNLFSHTINNQRKSWLLLQHSLLSMVTYLCFKKIRQWHWIDFANINKLLTTWMKIWTLLRQVLLFRWTKDQNANYEGESYLL